MPKFRKKMKPGLQAILLTIKSICIECMLYTQSVDGQFCQLLFVWVNHWLVNVPNISLQPYIPHYTIFVLIHLNWLHEIWHTHIYMYIYTHRFGLILSQFTDWESINMIVMCQKFICPLAICNHSCYCNCNPNRFSCWCAIFELIAKSSQRKKNAINAENKRMLSFRL